MTTIEPTTTGRYRAITGVAWATLGLIVLTGAAVRLTEAGLGCENWPACSDDRLVPEWQFHPWIEFGNRLISFVVTAAVVAALIGAYRQRPRRSDLIGWSWGLVAGVAAQIVLGGITVLVDLHPALVGLHFLLSMVLLWNAAVLWTKVVPHPPPPTALAAGSGGMASPANHGRLLAAIGALVLVTGTVVTGTGPNGGDSRADRLGFDLEVVARIHSATVWCFVVVLVALVVRLRGARAGSVGRTAEALLAVAVAQGAVGYAQFGLGVPPALVALHVLGAVVVWCLAVVVALRLGATEAEKVDRPLDTTPVYDTMGA